MALLSWLVTLLSVLIVALLVTLLGRSMFWYNHFYTSICLYGAAATGKIILIHTLAKNLYYGVSGLEPASEPCDQFYPQTGRREHEGVSPEWVEGEG